MMLTQLLDLLLLAGVLCTTLWAIATRYFGSHFSHETARQAVYDNLTTLKELIEADKIKQVIGSRYSLSDVPAAIAEIGAGHGRGKVVITV